MNAIMVSPTLFLTLIIVSLVTNASFFASADKLSPDLQAPLFAQGAGGLRLDPPFEGPRIKGVETFDAAILKESNHPNIGDGKYSFSFETEDGVQREEVGTLKKVGEELVTVVKGRYSYTSPEGLAIDVRYSADENGARSSFTFGTNPVKWKDSLSLIPGSFGDKGKLTSGAAGIATVGGKGETTGKGYLPPYNPPQKITNDYLPPRGTYSPSTKTR